MRERESVCVCVHACIYALCALGMYCVCVCMYVRTYVCMYVYVYVCVCVYVCMYVYSPKVVLPCLSGGPCVVT